jgi:gliding motility-associated-like protein
MFNTNITQQNCADCAIYVPTAFTPNGDGLNDVFKPKLNCLSYEFHCTIFNRWGQKIFETNDINKGWDGNYSGNKLPPGSYVYYISYKTSTGINKSARGMVVLIF